MDAKVLRFEFIPDEDKSRREAGWGSGALFLREKPFWYANTQNDPKHIDWTWVDFLEHIARCWPSLVAEQSYPFDWLRCSASDPGEIWNIAGARWANQAREVVYSEEVDLLRFARSHDLSAGWKGLSLPSLSWLRSGNSLWLSPENESPIRAEFKSEIHAVEVICDMLADSFKASKDFIVVNAVESWRNRNSRIESSIVKLSTGLSEDKIIAIQNGQAANDFWKLGNAGNVNGIVTTDNELLAAARMVRSTLSADQIAAVLSKIREKKRTSTIQLDKVSRQADIEIRKKQCEFPFEAGYRMAEWLRSYLKLRATEKVDVRTLLTDYGVGISEEDLYSSSIDALAFWGASGPYIFLNSRRDYSSVEVRTRMSLAHELCHFLIDRNNALPAVEVLGGDVDEFVEQRANAFAAELLLPRDTVVREFEKVPDRLDNFIPFLTRRYEVSRMVASWQILNSEVAERLSSADQNIMEKHINNALSSGSRSKKVTSYIS